jgi:hypothetical protein
LFTNPGKYFGSDGKVINTGSIGEHISKNDPWEAFKLRSYKEFRDRYLARIRGWKPAYLRRGNVHFDRLTATRLPNGKPLFDPALIAKTEFYFGANINGPNNSGGLALGNKILIGRPYGTDENLTRLLAHELAHRVQIERLGESRFGRNYIAQTIKHGMPAGIAGKSAHDALPLEREAHQYEEAYDAWRSRRTGMQQTAYHQSARWESRVNVVNPTSGTITFEVNYRGRWEKFDLLPGQSRWFNSRNSAYSVRYDADNTSGISMKSYTLRPNSSNRFTPVGTNLELFAQWGI